jgi:hypothetical protein
LFSGRAQGASAAASSSYITRNNRYYSTIREGGAENLQNFTEAAGLPKYNFDIQTPGILSF